MKTRLLGLCGLLALLGCGSVVASSDAGDDAGAPKALDGGSVSDVSTDGDGGECWRCADRAWRNVCVVPAERAPDSESCLHCGEHCVSDPPDAAGE